MGSSVTGSAESRELPSGTVTFAREPSGMGISTWSPRIAWTKLIGISQTSAVPSRLKKPSL